MCAGWVKKRAGEKYESASSGGASSDRHGKSDSSGEPTAPPNSEESLSLTFAKRHEDDLRFVAKWGQWFRWDGTRWVLEETLHAFDLSLAVCREAANACNKAGTSKAIASAKTVAAVERLAKVDRRLVATIRQWDIDADKFNTAEED
jgi:putative DNA primase/helicase